MTIRDIYTHEATNTSKVIFRRVGGFYRAFERSAFIFISQVRTSNVNVKCKFFKLINDHTIYIGIPERSLAKAALTHTLTHLDPDTVELHCDPISLEDFTSWKDEIVASTLRTKQDHASLLANSALKNHDLAAIIYNFPLDTKSPTECMEFIDSLQKLIRSNLNY